MPIVEVDGLPMVAGVAVLDLVNTVSWRGNPERRVDHLLTVDPCLTWAQRAGVITTTEGRRLRRLRPSGLPAELAAFREVVGRIAMRPEDQLDAAARAAIVDAYANAELVGSGGSRRWQVDVVDDHVIRRRLALELEWLLTADPGRIGVCGDEECRWVFLDTSRAQNRRWCRSADCGNRHRVREHHARQAAART